VVLVVRPSDFAYAGRLGDGESSNRHDDYASVARRQAAANPSDQGPLPVAVPLDRFDPREDLSPHRRRDLAVPGDFGVLLEEEQGGAGGARPRADSRTRRKEAGSTVPDSPAAALSAGRRKGPGVLLQAFLAISMAPVRPAPPCRRSTT